MTGAAASPALPAPFRADRAVRLALPVSYVLAYLYVDLFWFTPSAPLQRLLLTAFTVLFCAGTELLFRREKPSTESFVWLGCLLAVLASIAAGRCRVWGGWSVLFLHGFAVYWLLARSGRLLEGASGRLAPLDLLRGEMSFTGLVTSDCMEMQAVQKFFGSVNGVLAAMNAGVDLVLLSHTTLLSGEAAKAAAEALQSGKLDRKEMEESVDRILAAKAKLAAVPAAAFDAEQATALNDKLLRATITEVHVPKAGRPNVGGHPLCLGCQVYRTGLVGNVVDDVQQSFPVMMAKALGGDGFTTPIDPSEDEIYEWVRRAESYTSIVIGTYNGHLHPQQLELTKALAEHSGKPVIVVALRNPYDLFPLPESVYTLAAYEYTAHSTAAVADVLLGRHAATGRLPIATPEQEAQ